MTSESKKIAITRKGLTAIIALVLIAGMLIGAGTLYAVQTGGGEMRLVSAEKLENMEYMESKYAKTETLFKELKDKYYKQLSDDDLLTGIYRGLYEAAGDPYTTYLTAEEYESLMASTTGDFYGIGVVMSVKDDKITVVSTIEGSPAESAGIKTGDVILKVDGVAYGGSKMDEAASKMRGKLNTRVTIVYSRGGEEKTVTLIRKKIVTESVYSETLDGNIGYIRITSFESATGEDFKEELAKLEKAKVKGLIIDLRNNGGGIVDSGITVADALLPEGTIIYLEDKDKEKTYYNSDAEATSLPFVLLVNEGSASTSEIVAAAVKDSQRGTLVGAKTFGKGIVQIVEPLGDNSAVRITNKQYFSPSGSVIHEKGVEPDYVVELTETDAEDRQLLKAIELLK